MFKIWLDDEREAPNGFHRCHSVNEAIDIIENSGYTSFMLDLDHDLGEYSGDGGDAISLIHYLLWNGYHENDFYTFKFRIHTANPVGMQNMKSDIIRYFGWDAIV